TSVCFDLSVFELFVPLAAGGTIVLADNALALPTLADRERVTLVNTVPSAMSELVRQGGVPASVRTVNLAGEPLQRRLVEQVYERSNVARVWNLYGPSEDTTYSTGTIVGRGREVAPTIGRPVWNTRVYILDASMMAVALGVAGEVYIGGEGLARGYLGRQRMTAERFVPDPFATEPGARMYRTGDLARYLPDGEIEFLGRIDHQVKVRGFRIELGEIEARLLTREGVRETLVVVREDAAGDKRLVAYVVASSADAPPTPSALRRHLSEHLPDYMQPSAFVFLDAMPLTPNGKIDRKALPAPDESQAARESVYETPRTETEAALARLWGEVLGVELVGVRDNFFELGGHSLLATRVASRVRETCGVELPLRAIFESPTVAALAERVDAGRLRDGGRSPLEPIGRAPRGSKLPLSPAQRRLWFLAQLEPESPFYNLPASVLLEGKLDADALEEAFREAQRRHEILRTRFEAVDGSPVQIVDAATTLALARIDLRHLPVEEREAEARRLGAREARAPFDLARGPLWRVALLQLEEERFVLLLTLHHIIADGWSLEVLMREVAAAYAAFSSGAASPLPELPIQYADFAQWQRERLRDASAEQQLDYWRRRLAGAPPALELPTDKPRPPAQTYNGATRSIEMTPALAEALKRLSLGEGATLFTTLLAAFQTLLHRYTRQTDIVVGAPFAGRERAEVEPLVGFFVNTLPVRASLADDPTFRELLSRVRESVLEAREHQDVPFEKLVEALPARDASRSPIFQVMFALQTRPLESVTLPGLRLTATPGETGTSKFDLTLFVTEGREGLSAAAEYNTDVFESETIGRLLGHFRNLLEAVVADPERRASELRLVTDDERRQLVAGWNATRTEYPRRACVHELFDEQAARTPDAPALLFGEESSTYGELRQKANQLARHLQGLGVATGANVAVYVERSAEMVVAFLGVLKAGAAYVPLDLDYPRERLSFMLEDARCEVLITREALRDRLPAGGLKVVSLDLDAGAIARHETSSPASGATAAHPAYVIYTSGSTGRPKGVCVPHRAINRLVWNTNYVALGPDDRVGQLSNASFDAATFELWGALTHGALLVGIDKEAALAPRRLAEEIAGRRVTAMFITSALFSQVAAEVAGCFGGVKHLIVGGDAVDPKWARRVLAEGAPARFVNGYGPTESTTFAVCGEVTEVAPDARSIPIGRPISNTEAYVLDARLEPVPVGVAGELYIGGEGLALGYLHRPALTADRFVPDPFRGEPGARLYRTGDLARRLPDGRIDFLGRLDHQVKLRGFRVELGEIESLLSRHAGVRETVVVVREEGGDKRLVAYVVASAPGAPPAHAELRRHLKEQLPDYMIPAAFVTLDALPLTPNGKVDRRALPAPDESRPELEADYEAPRTPTEELLASVWADLLGVGRVGVRDDFFELGGHSLLATRVVSRVREACGVELPLRALFESPNVAALAELVEREKSSGGDAASLPLRRVERGEQSPLSFAQQRLWFLDQLEEGGAAYHIAASVRLRGALDVSSFERAVGEVVRRHEVLRTTFVSVDGGPVQSVAAPAPVRVPVVDLSEVTRDERDAEARRLAAEEARAPFDLARGPLLRTTLLRLDADEHLLLLTMHHIVSDGWSMGVLVREIAALYESFVTGGAHALAELPIQYADFAVLQREWLRGDALGAQLDYWKRQLAGKLPPLELPADRPRPASQSFRGATLRWKLGRELAEGLKGLGRREGATLFVTLLAAFQTLLHRYTGQADIAVGTPFANRNRLELEPLIGFFVNTLVMRTDLSGDPTFRELLGRTRETTLSAQAHQELPFEMLVEALRPERSLGHSPLFQVMFAFEGGAATRLELHGLRSELEHVETGTAKFELTLAATESADGIEAAFEYNTDLFDESTIRRMVGHFETLLAGVAADPDRPLSALPLLTEAEHRQLRDWNDTDIEVPSGELIHTLFEARAAHTPDALALVARDARLTCGELNARANQLARHLRETGVGPEVRVAVCAERTAEMVVALLAVLKAGGAYVPLDPAYPRERVAFMLEDSRARVLLTEQRLVGHLPAREGLTTFCLDGEWPLAARHAEDNLERAALPENLAYIIYTSGSTGVPKGVAIAHRSAVVLVEWAARAFAPDESEGVLASTSVCFDLSIYELFVPLARGGTIILADNALALPTLADAARVTLINTVPSAMTELVRAGAIPPSVRTVNLAGEPLPNELVQEIYSRSNVARVWNLYGPSEDTTYSTGAVIGRGANRQPSIGRPLANTQVHLLDANLRRVPVGVVG
ncbi:MAG TPA: amino acid adenylation domain-containing protein, partial [Pyrinomonadaceae bacterium]|nr:amino acid adenylation domain-containing protein [Pyrinomonadaceae bacterium]